MTDPTTIEDWLDDDYEDDIAEFDRGGVIDGFGLVHSDADPGL